MKSIKSAFNNASAHYDDASCVQKKIGHTLIKHLPHIQYTHGIDLGCGTGYTTQQLAKQIKFTHLDAIDMAEKMIEKASSRNNVSMIQFNIGSFDALRPTTYDLIFSNMALHWSPDFYITLTHMYAALKPMGVIAFSLPICGTFKELKPYFNVREFYTSHVVTKMLHQSGFHLKKIHTSSDILRFDNTLQALHSLKKTGATVCQTVSDVSYRHNRAAIKQQLINQLTYQIGLFIAEKS